MHYESPVTVFSFAFSPGSSLISLDRLYEVELNEEHQH